MTQRSLFSLTGVLLGFLCVFPLLRKRETKAAGNTDLYQNMTAARDALRDSALNASMWKE